MTTCFLTKKPVQAQPDALHKYAYLKGDLPPADVFALGWQGYHNLLLAEELRPQALLILVDFRLSSDTPRMWVVDMATDSVLLHTYSAHGKNSGDVRYASQFSNTEGSLQSSIGFYRTAETYTGKHGHSLRLDGMDGGFNDLARSRNIVMHSASYMNPEFLSQYGYCGRSWGCPAIPEAGHEEVLNKLAGGNCLLVFYPDAHWQQSSIWLKPHTQLEVAVD